MQLWDDHLGSGVARRWCSRVSGFVERSGLVDSFGRTHMGHSRSRGGGSRRAMVHPRPSVVVVAMPIGGRRGCRRSDPLAHTLWSVTAKALLMLFSSDIFCSRVGRGGSGDGATCSNYAPISAHVLARLRIPRNIRGCGRRSLRAGLRSSWALAHGFFDAYSARSVWTWRRRQRPVFFSGLISSLAILSKPRAPPHRSRPALSSIRFRRPASSFQPFGLLPAPPGQPPYPALRLVLGLWLHFEVILSGHGSRRRWRCSCNFEEGTGPIYQTSSTSAGLSSPESIACSSLVQSGLLIPSRDSLTQAKRLMCRRIGVQFEEPVANPADLLSCYADCFKIPSPSPRWTP
ncbi:uncharacterized protein [Triticum aestivum]|uniref:uncharacterized protein n=1 Tax=Triticum aestivum TaxID=4565 RepID=UPI001D01B63E|nr:uncharacterized protein LOC123120466 [Triticum aestivum]